MVLIVCFFGCFVCSIVLGWRETAPTLILPAMQTEHHVDKTRLSRVTSGQWRGQQVIFKRNYLGDMLSSQSLTNEITILSYLHDVLKSGKARIAQPLMTIVDTTRHCDAKGRVQTELIQEKGKIDVFEYARKLGSASRRSFTSKLMRRLLELVSFIHACNVAHNDIKPENMVIRDLELPTESIALIDFGFACIVDPKHKTHVHSGHGLWLDDKDFGTGCYRHPNLLERKPTDLFIADLYACGMVCFTMFTNCNPYSDYCEDLEAILPVHKSFADGTWKHNLVLHDHISKHDTATISTWADFIDTLCSGKCKQITTDLLQHAFLKE